MQGKQLYTLEDYAGDRVEGRFYREELQPVIVTGDEVYKIEKVIKTITKRGQPTPHSIWCSGLDGVQSLTVISTKQNFRI